MTMNKWKTLHEFYRRLKERQKKRKKTYTINRLVRKGKKESLRISKEPLLSPNFPIDFVVTWVNGNDPDWIAEKNKTIYEDPSNKGNYISRFREWSLFQYWFRGIEKYAPWVRYVYLVTWGHLPEWLNTSCSKIKIICHEEFIPQEYLPTFNSHTIEWNLWRIPGLSEHFVYFNDDMFLVNPVKPTDFFSQGMPRYTALAEPFHNINDGAHCHARFNGIGLMNSTFDISACIEKHPEKWFAYQYEEMVKYNIRAYEDGFISGMVFSHVAVPFRKSVMEEVFKHFSEHIESTCKHKLRTCEDVMHQVVQMWEMFNGNFAPVRQWFLGMVYSANAHGSDVLVESIKSSKYKCVCINDSDGLSQEKFEKTRNEIEHAFAEQFPDKSEFES